MEVTLEVLFLNGKERKKEKKKGGGDLEAGHCSIYNHEHDQDMREIFSLDVEVLPVFCAFPSGLPKGTAKSS